MNDQPSPSQLKRKIKIRKEFLWFLLLFCYVIWIPRHWFRIPDTEFPILGFRITWSVFRIPKPKIRSFHKRKFPAFPVIHGAKPFPLIIQPQKASKFFSWQWQMEKNCKQKKSFFFFKYIINPSFIDSVLCGLAHQHNFQELLCFFSLLLSPFNDCSRESMREKIELRVCLLGNSNDVQVIYFKISPACRFFRSQL